MHFRLSAIPLLQPQFMQGCYDPILQWFRIAICPMKAHNMYFTNKLWLLRKQNGCQYYGVIEIPVDCDAITLPNNELWSL